MTTAITGDNNDLNTANLVEADRLMTVCNSCRYCEGLCAVFPAMEMRPAFTRGDLNYLANLCHGCGACHIDCQFTPPHEFAINVPRSLAALRADTYAGYAWPGFLAGLYRRNAVAVGAILAVSVALFLAAFVTRINPDTLFGVHTGPGAFSRVIPHEVLALLFGGAFVFVIVALIMGLRAFWRDIGPMQGARLADLWQAVKDAATLRYLDGGKAGCFNDDDQPDDRRRFYHHLTMYGFLACFAATAVGTLYHYVLGWRAPYPWYQLPVIFGFIGGIGLIIGPIGLLRAKWNRNRELVDTARLGLDMAFPVMLTLTSASGLALLFFRATPAMGLLLALHLGIVFALFVTLPFGKFVHGLYRFAALVRYAQERARENNGH